MRTFSLNLLHKFVEIGIHYRQRTSDVVFWLKLIAVPYLLFSHSKCWKTIFTQVSRWKRQRVFLCLPHKSERFGSIGCTFSQNWVRQTFLNLSLHSCGLCSLTSYSAMQSIFEWTCSTETSKELRTQLNVLLYLWEGIYLSNKERKEGAQEKFDEHCANQILLLQTHTKEAVLPLSIRLIHNFILFLNASMSSDTSKNIFFLHWSVQLI